MHVVLAGASRGVGREVAIDLVNQSIQVTALLRSEATRSELEALGVQVAIADAMDAAAVEQAVANAAPVDAVISTLGGIPQAEERPDLIGNRNLIDAAVKAGVKRFILVTSIGTGNSASAMPPQAMEALRPVLLEKEKAEQHLIASGVPYTIIRPGGLKSEPATGNGLLTEDPQIVGSIHRADVARLVGQCLTSDRALGKTLSAVDRTLLYGAPEFVEFTP